MGWQSFLAVVFCPTGSLIHVVCLLSLFLAGLETTYSTCTTTTSPMRLFFAWNNLKRQRWLRRSAGALAEPAMIIGDLSRRPGNFFFSSSPFPSLFLLLLLFEPIIKRNGNIHSLSLSFHFYFAASSEFSSLNRVEVVGWEGAHSPFE